MSYKKRIIIIVIVAAVVLVSSSMAMAATCNVAMVAKNGKAIERFSSYDYDFQSACRQSIRQCTREQDRRSYDRVVRNSTCQVESRRPTPPQRKVKCSVNLINTNTGRVVNTFSAQANSNTNACNKANNKCFDARYNRANPYKFSCKKVRGSTRPKPVVVKYCSVDRVVNGRFGGRVAQTYTQSASGTQPSQVQSRACQKASQMCAADARYSGRRDTCVRRR